MLTPSAGEPRRVAVFLQDLAGGGAERVMLSLAGGLAQLGAPVDLVLVRHAGRYLEQVPEGVRLVPLHCRRTLLSVAPFRAYLRRHRPYAVISALPHVNITAILAARSLARRPIVVVTEHIHVSVDRDRIPFAWIRHAYRLAPFVYRLADHVVAVSDGAAADLAQHLGVERSRVETIYNPVVSAEISRQAARRPGHRWVGGDMPLLVAAGRLTEQKDFATLLRAFRLLRDERPCRLLILGEGPLRGALEAAIVEHGLSNDVELHGFSHDIYGYLGSARAFVLSSAWEALPTVLVEALACGTPVVSTDCPSGPSEILQGGQYGPLVPVGDAVALKNAIAQVLDFPTPADALRARASVFSVEAAARSYASLMGLS